MEGCQKFSSLEFKEKIMPSATTIQMGKLCIIVVKYLNMVMPICVCMMLVGTKACNLVVQPIA